MEREPLGMKGEQVETKRGLVVMEHMREGSKHKQVDMKNVLGKVKPRQVETKHDMAGAHHKAEGAQQKAEGPQQKAEGPQRVEVGAQ